MLHIRQTKSHTCHSIICTEKLPVQDVTHPPSANIRGMRYLRTQMLPRLDSRIGKRKMRGWASLHMVCGEPELCDAVGAATRKASDHLANQRMVMH